MRRYLASYAAFLALFGVALPLAVNFAVDPYQYFRRAWYEPRFSTNERWQMPGLARVYPYDTVILGTSTAQNYYPSTVDGALGGRVLKLAMSGASVHEQALILGVARGTGRVKRVLWSLEESQCRGAPDRVNDAVPFPHFLYDGGPAAWAGYLLNWSVLEISADILRSRPRLRAPDENVVPDDFDTYDKAYRFARDRAVADYELTNKARKASAPAPLDAAEMMRSCEANVLAPIGADPGIAFDIILPPYSILLWKHQLDHDPENFAAALAFSARLIERLLALPNVRVFDFRDVVEITHDLDRYKDMLHFDVATNRYIVESIAAGRHLVEASDPLASIRRLEAQAAAFDVPAAPPQARSN